MIEHHAGLAKQCRWLHARRYIYNLRSGTTFRRDVLAPQLPPHIRCTILATRTCTTRHVLAAPAALRTHFHTFFNRPAAPTPPAAFTAYVASAYHPLTPATIASLTAPLMLAELRMMAAAMRDTATGIFGTNPPVIAHLLHQPRLATTILAML